MANTPDFDVDAAHRFFSAECFNRAWDLIDKAEHTPEEAERMIHLAHASVWHWSQRPDCQPRNLAVGYWQLSRVYAVSRDAARAAAYGRRSLEASRGQAPFLTAYAHEALARAAAVAGDRATMARHLAEARALLPQVTDPQEKGLLEADLDTISS
jgi:gamma-glutamyl:cysteine ligase YbdK (ATP-grasp superfamily)